MLELFWMERKMDPPFVCCLSVLAWYGSWDAILIAFIGQSMCTAVLEDLLNCHHAICATLVVDATLPAHPDCGR